MVRRDMIPLCSDTKAGVFNEDGRGTSLSLENGRRLRHTQLPIIKRHERGCQMPGRAGVARIEAPIGFYGGAEERIMDGRRFYGPLGGGDGQRHGQEWGRRV
ncbi:hypothetical protein CEXT_765871 [Caerostris extrusa]|uniref:Uncharacterized protein n=1 Tax=Caerostris extrusa TaxID=172846 RepID=A0AAV4X9P1_CAEEX|nr:hypothetical protein CEXT_765871 [Caerostris extrusa]